MKIKTALILCAGFGKRLNPITLEKPKPLLTLNNITLLENTINLIKELGIKKIVLNTFYLKDQIKVFLIKGIDCKKILEPFLLMSFAGEIQTQLFYGLSIFKI